MRLSGAIEESWRSKIERCRNREALIAFNSNLTNRCDPETGKEIESMRIRGI
jgi:hypothetical protein